MLVIATRLGRRQTSSPRWEPSWHRTPSWMSLSARKASTAAIVPSRWQGVEDQPDHGLDLLVRIEGHLTGGAADEPDRQRHRQLSAAGLGDPPGPHPLADQVQLGLLCRSLGYAD